MIMGRTGKNLHMLSANIKEQKLEAEELYRLYKKEFKGGEISETIYEIDSFVNFLFVKKGMKFPPIHESDYSFPVRIHASLRWAQFGFPTFNLTHSLCAKLLLTDCRGIKGRDLRFPFSSFYVQVPQPSDFIVYSGDFNAQTVSANYILFHSLNLISDINEYKRLDQFLRGEIKDLKTARSLFTGIKGNNGALVHRTVIFPKDDESIEEFLSEFTDPKTADKVDPGLKFSNLDGSAMKATIRLIVNLSLYLRDLQAKGEWSPFSTAQKKKKKKHESETKNFILGKEIKISSELRKSASNALMGARWRVRSRFLVRGHWRRTRVGKGRERTELRWIEPFWKGPKEGEILERMYNIEDKK